MRATGRRFGGGQCRREGPKGSFFRFRLRHLQECCIFYRDRSDGRWGSTRDERRRLDLAVCTR
jgi:hypothetical protein